MPSFPTATASRSGLSPLLWLALSVLFHVALPRGAAAHGGLQPLASWGNFTPTAAYCQRIIGRAVARCAVEAALIRGECLNREVGGEDCDDAATTAAIIAVRRDTLDLVDQHCSERDAQAVGYLGNFDLQADIIRFCREWETTATSAAFATVLPSSAGFAPEDRACIAATNSTIRKLARLTFASWQATMNRIAARSWDLEAKTAMIDRGGVHVDAMQPAARTALEAGCGASRFEALYHRSAAELIAQVAARAGCFPSAFYLQDKLVCPDAVCGNWIVEPGETCDDGNTADGDGCDSACGR